MLNKISEVYMDECYMFLFMWRFKKLLLQKQIKEGSLNKGYIDREKLDERILDIVMLIILENLILMIYIQQMNIVMNNQIF